jgi:RNA polymerase I-specific transcription initiation factor RRN11
MTSLYLAQPSVADGAASFNYSLLRDAKSHFERAKTLDTNNAVAQAFLEKISTLLQGAQRGQADLDSEDDNMNMDVDDKNQRRKRVRI